jgi:hypothetical protein
VEIRQQGTVEYREENFLIYGVERKVPAISGSKEKVE